MIGLSNLPYLPFVHLYPYTIRFVRNRIRLQGCECEWASGVRLGDWVVALMTAIWSEIEPTLNTTVPM
jgi:hypothetical protein